MIITQTPLRVSLAGGGTDFPEYFEDNEGFVVSAAIDKYVFVIVTRRFDEQIYVNYSDKEIVDSVDDIKHELVREAMKLTGVESGVEVTLLSDIPSEGSGLGSSSSFTVGLLNAFHVLQGDQVDAERLATEACYIEIDRCGKPIGKQDQYIAAFGGVSAFWFKRDGIEVERLDLSDIDMNRLARNLYLFYSGVTRKSSDVLADQRKNISDNVEVLDGLQGLAREVRSSLLARNFDQVGRALDHGWRMKSRLSNKIATVEVTEMHTRVMSSGALGAKLCGAGGGGFLLVYCAPRHREELLSSMSEYREMPFLIERYGSKVIFNYSRYMWK